MLVAAIIIVALVLILLIPVSVAADYDENGFRLSARVLFANFRILAKREDAQVELETKNKNKKSKGKKSKKKKSKLSFSIGEWIEIAKKGIKILGRFRNSIRFDRLKLIFVSATDDPCSTAIRYNAVNAAIHTLVPLVERTFKVKKREIDVLTDYDSDESRLEFGLTLSSRIAQIIYVALSAVFSYAVIYVKKRIRLKRERKANRGQ